MKHALPIPAIVFAAVLAAMGCEREATVVQQPVYRNDRTVERDRVIERDRDGRWYDQNNDGDRARGRQDETYRPQDYPRQDYPRSDDPRRDTPRPDSPRP